MTTLRLGEWETRRRVTLSPDVAAMLRAVFGARVEPSAVQRGDDPTWDVTASGVVGVLERDGTRVVVRPKLEIENVLFLLCAGSGRDPWQAAEDARLSRVPDLTPAVASLFVRLAGHALARGVLRGYREERAELATVRGRIDLATQIRRRPGTNLPLAVAYAEHDADILENRLLLAAASVLRPAAAAHPATAQRLHRLRVLLSDVTPVHVSPSAVPAVTWTRLNQHYRPAVELARTVLHGSSVDVGLGDVGALGLTLDMADIFEDFLEAVLGRECERIGGVVRPQDQWFLDECRTVRMRPDLVWYGADRVRPRAVVDAKYKRERADGYPSADVYQLLAYCTALGLPEGHLVYAEGHPSRVQVVSDGPTIHAHALDLSAPPRDLLEQVARLAERIDSFARGSEPRRSVEKRR